jgi:chromosome segregation protein
LRPLERQADAARRHGDLVAELTAVRLFVAGRELSRLRSQLAAAEEAHAKAMAEARADAADERAAADARLRALGALCDALIDGGSTTEVPRGALVWRALNNLAVSRVLRDERYAARTC